MSVMSYDNNGYWEPYRSMNKHLNKGDPGSLNSAASELESYAKAATSRNAQQCGNFDIIVDPFSRAYQLSTTPHGTRGRCAQSDEVAPV